MSDALSAFGFRLNDCCIGSVTGTPDRQRPGSLPPRACWGVWAGEEGGWWWCGGVKTNRQQQHLLFFPLVSKDKMFHFAIQPQVPLLDLF